MREYKLKTLEIESQLKLAEMKNQRSVGKAPSDMNLVPKFNENDVE